MKRSEGYPAFESSIGDTMVVEATDELPWLDGDREARWRYAVNLQKILDRATGVR